MANRPAPALPKVFVTEGEKEAAALVSQRLAALALPGVWNFKNLDTLRGDWDVIGLKGQKVCIVFDSDAATNRQVFQAEDRLTEMLRAMGARVYVCRLNAGPNGAKTGADDFFARGGTVDELRSVIEKHQPEKQEAKPSATKDLIRLGKDRVTFWRDSEGEAIATVPPASGGFDNLPLSSLGFRKWLAAEAFRKTGRAAPREAMDCAIETLAAEAMYGDGGERATARRVGHAAGAVFADLCDSSRRIVRVTAEGWDFVTDVECPIRFIRPKHAGAFPEPVRGGDTKALAE